MGVNVANEMSLLELDELLNLSHGVCDWDLDGEYL